MQTLIADRTPTNIQGRVYGAHFAWSHLWWAGAYPLAGWLGTAVPRQTFLYGSLIGVVLLSIVHLLLAPERFAHTHAEVRHTHDRTHDLDQLETVAGADEPHCHPGLSHRHPYTDISHEHHAP